MAVRDRSIGSTGLEQGGPNMGNDYSRDISREQQSDDTLKVIIPKNKKNAQQNNEKKRGKDKRSTTGG